VNFNQSKNITWNFIFLWDCKKTKKTNSRFKNGDNFFLSAQHIHASFYYAIWQIILQSGPNSNNNNNAYFINEEEQRLRNAAINSIRKMRHQPGKTKDSFLITLLQQLIRFQQCSSYFSWLILLLHYLEVILCLMSEWVSKKRDMQPCEFFWVPSSLSFRHESLVRDQRNKVWIWHLSLGPLLNLTPFTLYLFIVCVCVWDERERLCVWYRVNVYDCIYVCECAHARVCVCMYVIESEWEEDFDQTENKKRKWIQNFFPIDKIRIAVVVVWNPFLNQFACQAVPLFNRDLFEIIVLNVLKKGHSNFFYN